jgi:hypothetical protein
MLLLLIGASIGFLARVGWTSAWADHPFGEHEDRHWGVHFMVLSREAWNARRRGFAGVLDLQMRFEGVEPAIQTAGVVQPMRPAGPQTGSANGGRP